MFSQASAAQYPCRKCAAYLAGSERPSSTHPAWHPPRCRARHVDRSPQMFASVLCSRPHPTKFPGNYAQMQAPGASAGLRSRDEPAQRSASALKSLVSVQHDSTCTAEQLLLEVKVSRLPWISWSETWAKFCRALDARAVFFTFWV